MTTPHPAAPPAATTGRHAARPMPPPAAPYRRYVSLDVLRALALFGVFTINIGFLARGGEGKAAQAVEFAEEYLLHDKSRTLLSILFGAGAALLWMRGADIGRLWRRYAVLFAVFGAVNLYFFPADILTHYAVVGALLVPFLPWLMRGSLARPLMLAAGFAALQLAARTIAPPCLEFGTSLLTADGNEFVARTVLAANQLWSGLVLQGPWTATAFTLGIWLARRLELTGSAATGLSSRRRSATLAIGGTAVAALGHFATARLPMDGNEAMTGMPPAFTAAWMAAGFGGAIAYVGLFSLLLERGGIAARALTRLAPFGRLTLTAYLTSTLGAVALTAWFSEMNLVTGFAAMTALWIAFAVFAPFWMRKHRYGPAESLWRKLA